MHKKVTNDQSFNLNAARFTLDFGHLKPKMAIFTNFDIWNHIGRVENLFEVAPPGG